MTKTRKSLYSKDGDYIKGSVHCVTIGELLEELKNYPTDLPIGNNGIYLTWVNVGQDRLGVEEHLVMNEDDIWGVDE